MSKSRVKITYPLLKFSEKARRPGGRPREAAIAAAAVGVEAVRDDAIADIAGAVDGIERIVAGRGEFGTRQLRVLIRHGDRVVTMAETYGYAVLAFVAKSFCDLAEHFIEAGNAHREPFQVHLTSLRLVTPPRTVTQADAERVLGELSRILIFYGCLPREELRLKALRKLGILDTEIEARYDRLLAETVEEFAVPMAAISLIDRNRQWFKSRVSIEAAETPRSIAFCNYTIQDDGVLIVEDATLDSRFSANPLVTGPMSIRFYAGAPLKAPDGQNVGALCIIDRQPRTLAENGQERLAQLAGIVSAMIQSRKRKASAA